MRLEHSSWQRAAAIGAVLLVLRATAIGQTGAPVASGSDAGTWQPPRTSWGDPDLARPSGRWEGDTLVVETSNFNPKMNFRGSNPDAMRLVERFTPTGPDTIEWRVTVDDPTTWEKPFTFALDLTRDDREAMIEYACHEGNMAMANILSGHRADERAVAAAAGR